MEKFAHDTITPNSNSSLEKREQVAGMFNDIAHRYDLLNRMLSGGIDVYWRKRALRELKKQPVNQLLDVATGTAEVAIMASKILHPKQIIGVDIAEGMLELGRKKIQERGIGNIISLETGDSEHLRFSNDAFDAITVAFGVRNFQRLSIGLQEMYRVLKPGGKIVVLEFSKPTGIGFKQLYQFYMNYATPTVGKLVSKNRDAYEYLNKSVQAFPEGENFLRIMQEAGFSNTYLKKLSFGICTIYCGSK